ncbi:MAG: hypothetical protein COB83_12250 [Gammaproteobacteria bacterium]|nr:MAG: hypothetical protein COB83_12250 [Gammaproteobacteria bacterium]
MFKGIISHSVQKVFLPLWAVLIIFVLVDVSVRLTNYEIKNKDNWKITSVDESADLKLSQEQAKTIIKNINNFEVTTEPSTESDEDRAMSAAEQLTQQGDLSQLYAGNIQYRLVGIFDKNGRFAVIQQFDTTVNEKKLIRVSALDSLQNYKITKILADKVILNSDDDRQISLHLYKKLDKKPDESLDKQLDK